MAIDEAITLLARTWEELSTVERGSGEAGVDALLEEL
jgi:hypothetical protein